MAALLAACMTDASAAVTPDVAAHGGGDAAAPAGAPGEGMFRLSEAGGAVTLESRGAPLGQVLDALASAGGFIAELPAHVAAHPLSVVVREQPLETVLKRILDGASFLVTYERDRRPGQTPDARRIARLHILVTGTSLGGDSNVNAKLAQNPPSAGNAPAAVSALPQTTLGADPDSRNDEAIGKLTVVARDAERGPEERLRALEGLGEFQGSAEARGTLVESLKDPDPRVRRTAITLVGSMNSDLELKDALVGVIGNDEDPAIRKLGLNTLVMSYPQEEVVATLERATNDPDPEVSGRARMLLKGMGGG